MNRKRIILAVLLGVLALCLVYAYVATPRLEKVPIKAASQRARSDVKVSGAMKVQKATERVDFDFLTSEPKEFKGAKRDIFRFGQQRPIQQKAPVPVVATPVAVPVTPVMPVMPVQPVLPFEVVQQSLAKFTFLGFLEKAGEKTVFLSSGGNLFLAKRGESFGDAREFQIVDIDDKLLKVRHAGRDGLLEIPLIEQQKLSASVSAPARLQPAAPAPPQRTGTLTPRRGMPRPAAPQESEESLPEMIEENAPTEGQEAEPSAEGDVLEGETNGSNQ